MKNFLRAAGVGLGILAAFVGATAWAQVPGPYLNPSRRPAVSPYINLARPFSDPAVNYYGIVRPEVGFRASLQQLQQQEALLAQGQQDLTTAILPPTGHMTGFQNQSKYFMTKGARAAATAPTTAAPMPAAKGRQPTRR
jgi:hypothetical protein